jgi:hypothetical protein
MAKKPAGFGIPKNDLYGQTKTGVGNPLPKMARTPILPKMPKAVPFNKRTAKK